MHMRMYVHTSAIELWRLFLGESASVESRRGGEGRGAKI